MFSEFKAAIDRQWQAMSKHELFRTGADKDAMWTTYLGSFPKGSNPIFRERTEHDCSCCRQFVRAIGDVVAIVDGRIVSLWDIETPNQAYQTVAQAMAELVREKTIDNVFLHTEATAGTDKNYEQTDTGALTWEHFFVRLPNSRVCRGVDIGPRLSETRALHDVLKRSLVEIKVDAVDAVLELIGQNALYRGQEHQHALTTFRQTQTAFAQLSPTNLEPFVWSQIGTLPGSVSKIRNTSIGTLLVDLSEGMDLEGAVRKFEAMVAPANYKRPTALVTPAMVAKAKATVEELGLTSALERRYAHLTDITVNNVLYADRSAKKAMSGGAFDDIATSAAVKPASFEKAQNVGIAEFLAEVLPQSTSVELLVENRHAGNLVSLIAPVDPNAGQLFRWDNRFSWSYAGDFADSVKERVKKAGGNVTGELCCRLGWFNTDDLDFHMVEPGPEHIYYANKISRVSRGQLDVDMNVMTLVRDPVENIFYETTARMREGTYQLAVNQFTKRNTADVGFEAEIDFKGTVYRFAYPKALRLGETVTVATFRYSHAKGLEIIESLPSTTTSRKVWNIDTGTFNRVNVVMLSPNHWDGHGVGNRHHFFMLANCQNDGTARGFYNEFLRGDLDQHRKVLELVGAKMRTDEATNQLSGLGFSSTQRNDAIVRVNGARVVRVQF
ncbi:MAG TPA: hypothetical protein VNU68_35435 [Verrucomicrobiae bacterium]|nr:hypothetical protein [Verrucomicrobiae bacterium]